MIFQYTAHLIWVRLTAHTVTYLTVAGLLAEEPFSKGFLLVFAVRGDAFPVG